MCRGNILYTSRFTGKFLHKKHKLLTVKVPERVRFWHENVHLSANHNCSGKKSRGVIGSEVCIFLPKSYTFRNLDGAPLYFITVCFYRCTKFHTPCTKVPNLIISLSPHEPEILKNGFWEKRKWLMRQINKSPLLLSISIKLRVALKSF